MVIAIDGPAGTGKSTVASRVAKTLNFTFLNSGSFYRAVAFVANRAACDLSDVSHLVEFVQNLEISYKDSCVFVNGENVEPFLCTEEVASVASRVSSIPEIRHIVNRRMAEATAGMSIVCEGRDMTTVVFPNAEVKIYLDAPLEVQTRRRYQQQKEKGIDADLDEIRRQIAQRDVADRNKVEGSLVRAPDAFYIDTADIGVEEVCEKILERWKKVAGGRH